MTNHGEPTGTVLVSVVLRPLTEPPAYPYAELELTSTVAPRNDLQDAPLPGRSVTGQVTRRVAELQLRRLGYPTEAVSEIVDVVLQGHTVEGSGYVEVWED
jgi:hypothetical protein